MTHKKWPWCNEYKNFIVFCCFIPNNNTIYEKRRALTFRQHRQASSQPNLSPRYSPNSPAGISSSLRPSHSCCKEHVPPQSRQGPSSSQRHLRSRGIVDLSGELFRGEPGGLQRRLIFVDEAGGEVGQLLPVSSELQKGQIHLGWCSAAGGNG